MVGGRRKGQHCGPVCPVDGDVPVPTEHRARRGLSRDEGRREEDSSCEDSMRSSLSPCPLGLNRVKTRPCKSTPRGHDAIFEQKRERKKKLGPQSNSEINSICEEPSSYSLHVGTKRKRKKEKLHYLDRREKDSIGSSPRKNPITRSIQAQTIGQVCSNSGPWMKQTLVILSKLRCESQSPPNLHHVLQPQVEAKSVMAFH